MYGLKVCVSPEVICWNLTPKVVVLKSGAFGRWLGHEGRALMDGISILLKETPEISLNPSTVWGHCEMMAIYEEVGCHQKLNLPVPWP